MICRSFFRCTYFINAQLFCYYTFFVSVTVRKIIDIVDHRRSVDPKLFFIKIHNLEFRWIRADCGVMFEGEGKMRALAKEWTLDGDLVVEDVPMTMLNDKKMEIELIPLAYITRLPERNIWHLTKLDE